MASKRKVLGKVVKQNEPASGIYDLWIETDLAKDAFCGQFVGLYPKDKSHLLPRPISICEVNKAENMLRLVYRVQGAGTREFSSWKEGEEVWVLGVLGNGFPLEEGKDKKALLIGGGIGIPPILQLSKEFQGEKQMILGYRNQDLFLIEEFEKNGEVLVATEDGSKGVKGNVLDAIKQSGVEGQIIYACGPLPMLKALKEYAKEKQIPAYLSLEERMACGVGACLGCVCNTSKKDHHSHVNNARICTEGPVFLADDIMI